MDGHREGRPGTLVISDRGLEKAEGVGRRAGSSSRQWSVVRGSKAHSIFKNLVSPVSLINSA